MRLQAADGIRGQLFDDSSGAPKRICKPVWFDDQTGEYEALRTDDSGQRVVRDHEGRPIRYRGRGKLRFVPRDAPPRGTDSPTFQEHPPVSPQLRKRVEKLPALLVAGRCHGKDGTCQRWANWMVIDEEQLPPVQVNGRLYEQARMVSRRYYCAFCWKGPRLYDAKGELIQEDEEAHGVRPQ